MKSSNLNLSQPTLIYKSKIVSTFASQNIRKCGTRFKFFLYAVPLASSSCFCFFLFDFLLEIVHVNDLFVTVQILGRGCTWWS